LSEKDQEIGKRLAWWRREKDLKGKDLAKILDISSGTLSDIEKGRSFPSGKTFSKLLRLTDINMLWLLTGEGETPRDTVPSKTLDRPSSGEIKVIGTLERRVTSGSGEMSSHPAEACLVDKIIELLSKDLGADHIKKILDSAWNQASQDQRGWLKIEITSLLKRFSALIKKPTNNGV